MRSALSKVGARSPCPYIRCKARKSCRGTMLRAPTKLFTKPLRLRPPKSIVVAVEKENTDDEEDDGPDQVTPGFKGRKKFNDKIHNKKNNADAANDPARPSVTIDQKEPHADDH